MAIISKIRERSGLAVSLVAISMILFIVGGDLISGNSRLLNMFSDKDKIGSINGEEITYQEYQAEIAELEADFQLNQQKAPSEQDLQGIREQAWNQLILKKAFLPQTEKAGIVVSEAEQVDMVQGENIHPSVRQAFSNPQTGEFDRNQIKSFLANVQRNAQQSEQGARQYIAWTSFERKLPDDRRRTRYEALLGKTIFVTSAEARREYEAQSTKANIKYLYIPYTLISDSTVKPSDAQLAEYLNKNKDRYKGNDAVSFDYVQFQIKASAQDSANLKNELTEITQKLATEANDTAYAAATSDEPANVENVSPKDLPAELAGVAGGAQTGMVYGPYLVNGSYKIYKVLDINNNGTPSARASHILFKWNNPTAEEKAVALKKANEILAQIKGGASFEDMARQYGTDGTASQGGDLGFFSEGQMVPKFQDAVFNAKSAGLLPAPIETEFGYHLIKVTSPKNTKNYKTIAITKKIEAGTKTQDSIYNVANMFASTATDKASFEDAIKKNPSLAKLMAQNVNPQSYSFNDIFDGREVVRWAFTTEKPEQTSQIFTLKDRYVIAYRTAKSEEGKPTVESARAIITPAVIKDLKAKMIMDKIAGAKTLEEMNTKFGNGAILNTQNDVALSSPALQDIGYDPMAVGKVFSLKAGAISKPFKGESGVVAIQLVSSTPADKNFKDIKPYQEQLQARKNTPVQYVLLEAVKEIAQVKDKRIKAF